jgi:hypothetical protein
MKRTALTVFLALIGTGYIIYVIVSGVSLVGTTLEPTYLTWWSFGNFMLFLLSFHWSIEWIKNLFKDEL